MPGFNSSTAVPSDERQQWLRAERPRIFGGVHMHRCMQRTGISMLSPVEDLVSGLPGKRASLCQAVCQRGAGGQNMYVCCTIGGKTRRCCKRSSQSLSNRRVNLLCCDMNGGRYYSEYAAYSKHTYNQLKQRQELCTGRI